VVKPKLTSSRVNVHPKRSKALALFFTHELRALRRRAATRAPAEPATRLRLLTVVRLCSSSARTATAFGKAMPQRSDPHKKVSSEKKPNIVPLGWDLNRRWTIVERIGSGGFGQVCVCVACGAVRSVMS
jgi:hypothetical protein